MWRIGLLGGIAAAMAIACGGSSGESQSTVSPGRAVITEIEVDCQQGGQSNLLASDSRVYLSWIEYVNDSTDALVFSSLQDTVWSAPLEISRGSDWFVNWADFPSLISFGPEQRYLAAHWLQKSASGTYDYDVRIALSADGGSSWNRTLTPHRDGVAAEHGFVSMVPVEKDRFLVVWLDGRNMGSSHDNENHSGHGAMTLRAAEIDINGVLYQEAELDSMVCECCQTDAVSTPDGPVVVYRDRSGDEIRDIALVRYSESAWSAPAIIHEDNWEISGCPVNGPAISASGNHLAVAWYTAANAEPSVNVAFQSYPDEAFSNPVRIDAGNPAGRVDVEWISPEQVMVTWIEQKEQDAQILAARVSANGQKLSSKVIAPTSGSRGSGFPVLVKTQQTMILTYTDVSGESPRVRSLRMSLKE